MKHQAVDAFREMAAVLEEQLWLDEQKQKNMTSSSSDLQKYKLLLLSAYVSAIVR